MCAALREAELGDTRFDKIFATHVGVFSSRQAALELGIVANHLANGGSFSLLPAARAGHGHGDGRQVVGQARGPCFAVDSVLVEDLTAATAVAIVARKR